jgi:GNAT superfamily N-acetyltransferase
VTLGISPAEKLSPEHVVTGFDCGVGALNEWLLRIARTNQAAGTSQTYVVHRAGRVVGYYAIAAASVHRDESPERVVKGLARHPVPVAVIARLAVDRSEHGKGVGAALLKDALMRIAGAADIIGVRAVLVHAKDEAARAFYQRFDFVSSPVDPLQMFLLMKDVRHALGLD